jgi:tRNA A-37 threonylcarbamoyl transferase component Bud32
VPVVAPIDAVFGHAYLVPFLVNGQSGAMTMPTSDAPDHTTEQLRDSLGGEFEILRLLGKGATSLVYLARERALGRLVAIKVLRRAKADDETARRRFEREARTAASISEHPDVVAVHRYGRLKDDTPYLVMRYVKGRTMEERLAAEGRLPNDHAREVLLRVASALAAAHERGIVHRDVRPGNVLWDDEAERAYLSDFGIAAILATSGMDSSRITQTGQLVGDPRYLSPEQLQDEELTEQSDIYGLGILGYELFTGQGPYEASNNAEWIRAHLMGVPRNVRDIRADVPNDVADLLLRCLSREPNHRPRAADVVRILSTPAPVAGVRTAGPGAEAEAGDIAELIKRRVPQVVGLAIVVGVGAVSLMAELVGSYSWPRFVLDFTIVTAVAGFFASAVLAWFHGEAGRQQAPKIEFVLLGAIGVGWLIASVVLFVKGG